MRVRGAVRRVLRGLGRETEPPLVLVALSGGADSLALAAAVAAEAAASGVRAGAVIVDHALQEASAEVAERAAAQAQALPPPLDPVLIYSLAPEICAPKVRVNGVLKRNLGRQIGGAGDAGPEGAARAGRYRAFIAAASEVGAVAVLTAHTRDDQAEQVLLGLARGSGLRSISGMPAERELAPGIRLLRPLLAESAGVTREVTERACAELGLTPWHDPHNTDPAFARVRVRRAVLPFLAEQLGPGISASLARTADLAREDAEALDSLAWEVARPILAPESAERMRLDAPVARLSGLPAALRDPTARGGRLRRDAHQGAHECHRRPRDRVARSGADRGPESRGAARARGARIPSCGEMSPGRRNLPRTSGVGH